MRPTAGKAFLRPAQNRIRSASSRDVVLDVGLDAVELAQQDRLGVDRVAGVDEILRGGDREPVHHLKPAGDDAGGDDVADRAARLLHRVEAREQRPRHLRPRQQPDRHFRDDAEQAFRSREQREEVEAGGVERAGPERHPLALDREDLDREHVVHRQAVLQAVHAARVFGDVAADGAGDLRRRVGRVVEAVRLRRLRDGEVAHAGLHARVAPVRAQLEDPVEARHHEQHALLERQCAAGQPRPRAAGDDRHPAAVTDAQHLRDLLDALGEHDQQRHRAVRGEPVALVRTQVLAPVQDLEVGQLRLQRRQQLRPIDAVQRTVDALVVEDAHGGGPAGWSDLRRDPASGGRPGSPGPRATRRTAPAVVTCRTCPTWHSC